VTTEYFNMLEKEISGASDWVRFWWVFEIGNNKKVGAW
jgi:hypothetical protein